MEITVEESIQSAQGTNRAGLLAPEDLAQTLSCIETILSLYATGGAGGKDEADVDDEGDVEIIDENEQAIRNVAQFLRLPLASLGDERSTKLRDAIPSTVSLGLRLRPWLGTSSNARLSSQVLMLDVTFALRRPRSSPNQLDTIRWPGWILRKETWLEEEIHVKLTDAARTAADAYRSSTAAIKDGSQLDESAEMASYVLLIAETISEKALDSANGSATR